MRWATILLIPFVLSLIVTEYPIKNSVYTGDYAIYKFVLYNDEPKEISVRIYGPNVEEKTLSLDPLEKKEVFVRIKCIAGVEYSQIVYVDYDGNTEIKFVKIYGKSIMGEEKPICSINYYQDGNDYIFDVRCTKKVLSFCVEMGNQTKCGKEKIIFENINAKSYPLRITIYLEDQVITYTPISGITVLPNIKVEKWVKKKDYFFLEKYTIYVKNLGNYYYYDEIRIKKEGIPLNKEYYEEDGYYLYPIIVGPGEEKMLEVKQVKNLWVLLIPIVAVGSYFGIKRIPPIKVSKEYFYYSRNGSTFVHIVIKIKGNRNAFGIHITDSFPKYGKLEKFETIAPEISGNTLIWRIPKISKGETILLNYTLKFDFEIVKGDIKLPPLKVFINGKEYKISPKKVGE